MNLLKFKEFLAKFDDAGNPIPQVGDLVPWIDISNLLFNEDKSVKRRKKQDDPTPDAPLTGMSTITITQDLGGK